MPRTQIPPSAWSRSDIWFASGNCGFCEASALELVVVTTGFRPRPRLRAGNERIPVVTRVSHFDSAYLAASLKSDVRLPPYVRSHQCDGY